MNLQANIDEAIQFIREKTDFMPEAGMILGSGLGDFADRIEDSIHIPYADIPGFPLSTVEGHKGCFVMGNCHGKRVIAMQGRFHFYEGYNQQTVTMPVRVMKKLGVTKLIITNAAGGVNLDFSDGTLMLISDHINYSGDNPLIGQNLSEFGERFPDMTYIYDREVRENLIKIAQKEGIQLREGVYMMFTGPSYETPAEIRMSRAMGADAVGMSTVPEAIVARHCGLKTVGISCITNMAAGVKDKALNHQEVVQTATRVKKEFTNVLTLLLERVL